MENSSKNNNVEMTLKIVNSSVGEENVKTFLRCGYFTKTIKAKVIKYLKKNIYIKKNGQYCRSLR